MLETVALGSGLPLDWRRRLVGERAAGLPGPSVLAASEIELTQSNNALARLS